MAIIVVVGLKQRKESELELSQNCCSSRTNEVISPASGSIVLQRNPLMECQDGIQGEIRAKIANS